MNRSILEGLWSIATLMRAYWCLAGQACEATRSMVYTYPREYRVDENEDDDESLTSFRHGLSNRRRCDTSHAKAAATFRRTLLLSDDEYTTTTEITSD